MCLRGAHPTLHHPAGPSIGEPNDLTCLEGYTLLQDWQCWLNQLISQFLPPVDCVWFLYEYMYAFMNAIDLYIGTIVSTRVWGKKTLVPMTSQLSALDHEVKFMSSLIPPVTIISEILDDTDTIFYWGDVRICLKDAIFMHQAIHTCSRTIPDLEEKDEIHTILFLYTDVLARSLIKLQLCNMCSDLFIHWAESGFPCWDKNCTRTQLD